MRHIISDLMQLLAEATRGANRATEMAGAGWAGDRYVLELGWPTAMVWECELRKPYAASTLDDLMPWLWSDEICFESALVRPRAAMD